MNVQRNASGPDPARRRVLAGAAVLGVSSGFSLVELALSRSPEEAASKLVRWGLLIDTQKCAEGCDDCVTACDTEHNLEDTGRPRSDARWIRKLAVEDERTGLVQSMPMLCQHCEHPPCVAVCPTGASFRRDDGVVLVDKHTCIGCRYCMLACPYSARSFVHENLRNQVSWSPRGKGTVESCTLCVHRVDEDRTPACVEACTGAGHEAMVFGDLNDRDSEIARRVASQPSRQVRADLGLDTAVRYQNL